jgi:hypothetical protein
MRLELSERLICPSSHERTPLIVMALETRERDLVRGTAGCMTCHRNAAIAQGDVVFDTSVVASNDASTLPESSAIDRLEAQLGLSEPGARVLLSGRYAQFAAALAQRVDALVVVLNAPVPRAAGVGGVYLAEPVVPFSDATFNAAAVDQGVSAAQLADVVRTLQRGGRLVATLPMELPDGVRELARDATEWVGTRDDVIRLRRNTTSR